MCTVVHVVTMAKAIHILVTRSRIKRQFLESFEFHKMYLKNFSTIEIFYILLLF